MIDILLPGTGAMTPLPGRWLSCLALRTGGNGILFDCGEGTQIALKAANWGFRDIDAIVLSHLHADHVAGLVGMLLMLGSSQRSEKLTIYGPPMTATIVTGQRMLARILPYEVEVIELWPGESFSVGEMRVRSESASHRVPCLAYRLELPRRRRFFPEKAQALGLPVGLWRDLQNGESVSFEGNTVTAEAVLGQPRPGITLTFMTDTRPTPTLVELAREADLLVCEGTFGSAAEVVRAEMTGHMTFAQAATLARDAQARALLLTHFSAAMPDPDSYAQVATSIFPNTTIGHDGLRLRLGFRDEGEAEPGSQAEKAG